LAVIRQTIEHPCHRNLSSNPICEVRLRFLRPDIPQWTCDSLCPLCIKLPAHVRDLGRKEVRILAYSGNLCKVHLLLVSRTPIQRHVKVKGEANPYDLRLRNLLRETRSGSYGGDVSGYSKTSLSLELPTRDLPRMQYTDHPNHGMASSSLCPPCDGRVQECREPRFASTRVPRQGSPPRDFCITTASPRKRRSKGVSRMTGNRHVRF
jgi:hypothetical protein